MSEDYLFIISQHRTGSTLLKNILDAHDEVSMAFDEMNLYEHFRSNTLDRILDKQQLTAKELTSLLKEQKVYGTFWKDFDKAGLGYQQMEEELAKENLGDALAVVGAVLRLLKKHNKTIKSGVKYPVHFSKLSNLISKFPESRIVFLTRHPAAIIASKLNDPATKKRKQVSLLHRFAVHYFTILYFSLEFAMSVRKYRQFKKKLHLVRYEDLVLRKEQTIKEICTYCDLDFKEELMNAGGKESSHGEASDQGVHARSLDRYKSVLNKFDLGLISLITGKGQKAIQHESSTHV